MAIDTAKFTVLLKPHYNDALKYSKALCAGWQAYEAEDVLQQSFLLALENFESLKDESKFRSWFFKIITREFYNSIRKSFWKKFLPVDSIPSVLHIPEVFDRADADEERILIEKALTVLSLKERTAILLFEVSGFSTEEIRELQNENSISSVKSRLSRARSKMKEFILNYDSIEKKKFKNNNNKSSNILGEISNETIKLVTESKGK